MKLEQIETTIRNLVAAVDGNPYVDGNPVLGGKTVKDVISDVHDRSGASPYHRLVDAHIARVMGRCSTSHDVTELWNHVSSGVETMAD